MVDPNRKINRLTDKDIEFLEECEQEYGLRYTDQDAEFVEHCNKPLDDPPVVENWGFGGNDHHNRKNWRGSRGGGYNHRNFRHRRGGSGDGRDDGSSNRFTVYKRPSFNQQECSSSGGRSPMSIRKDYSNFVAASKDE